MIGCVQVRGAVKSDRPHILSHVQSLLQKNGFRKDEEDAQVEENLTTCCDDCVRIDIRNLRRVPCYHH